MGHCDIGRKKKSNVTKCDIVSGGRCCRARMSRNHMQHLPGGKNTPSSGEGTAEGVGYGSYGLGRLLLDTPETQ